MQIIPKVWLEMNINIPDAFEKATATMIRKYAEIGPGVTIRCWQSLRFDGSWDSEKDKTCPYIDIRFAPEAVDDTQSTAVCNGGIGMATKTSDDRDHAAIKALYMAVHQVLRDIFKEFMARTTDGKYDEFVALVKDFTDGEVEHVSVRFTEPEPPSDDGGDNVISIGFAGHFPYI